MAAWRSILGATAMLLPSACSAEPSTVAADPVEPGRIDVVAAFYPLQFVAEQVGGDAVSVTNLTPAGAEPHELELSARDAGRLQDADVVVYLDGFAPALDDAIHDVDAAGFDVTGAADLDRATTDAAPDEDGRDRGEPEIDPHFWLDPLRLAAVGDAVAAELGSIDPGRADEFTANAATLRAGLEQLDGEFGAGLGTCASTDLVTSHEAFGYLADRYGLTQVGIAGLSPDSEPSPATLADVADFVDAHDVTTIYYESLVDPSIAETVAAETGAGTAALDPLEGLSDESAGSDYFAVMRSNLAMLRAGQVCG
ncbi:MAG: zinc ABC transporter substrate-binding protein [Ilumatobacteraceae bacterium]